MSKFTSCDSYLIHKEKRFAFCLLHHIFCYDIKLPSIFRKKTSPTAVVIWFICVNVNFILNMVQLWDSNREWRKNNNQNKQTLFTYCIILLIKSFYLENKRTYIRTFQSKITKILSSRKIQKGKSLTIWQTLKQHQTNG